MKISELWKTLQWEVCVPVTEDREITGCYICDFLSWVIGKATEDQIWLTVQNNVNVAAVAVLCEVSCVLLTENITPDEALKARAQREGIAIFSTPHSSYEAAIRIYESIGLRQNV